MTAVTFRVRGLPRAQGSAKAFVAGRRAVVVTKGRGPLADWRAAMAQAASEAMAGAQLLTGPVRVHLDFRPASRPASHYLPANRRRPVRELRLDAPSWYATTPDVDKLARAALDSLTGIVFEDDRQVAWLVSLAKWPSPDEVPGVTVTVSPLEATR